MDIWLKKNHCLRNCSNFIVTHACKQAGFVVALCVSKVYVNTCTIISERASISSVQWKFAKYIYLYVTGYGKTDHFAHNMIFQ